LLADTYLEALRVTKMKKNYNQFVLNNELLRKVEEMATGGQHQSIQLLKLHLQSQTLMES
jgi:hypothetical protein